MNFSQLESIGFNYIKNLLNPASDVGVAALKKLRPYKPEEINLLEDEWDSIENAVNKINDNSDFFEELLFLLGNIKDIRQSFERLESEVLSESELFEIKVFLIYKEKINTFLLSSGKGIFKNLTLNDTTAALKLLSKSGAGGFFIGAEYSNALAKIRHEKEEAAKKIIQAKDHVEKEKFLNLHLSLAAKEETEIFLVLKKLTNELANYKNQFLSDLDSIAKIDLILSKAKLAANYKCIRPVLNNSLIIKNAVNPYVASHLKFNKFTPISLSAVKGTTIITGANMGGKTVALKTIALNAYLALCGFFVFAEYFALPFFNFVKVMLDDFQNTKRGLSSFGGEVVHINELFLIAENNGLVLIDEFAAGTNAEEGAKIFKAVAKSFNDKNSIVIMSTHFDGVASVAKAHYQVVGLSNAPIDKIKELLVKNLSSPTELIASFMDYGLQKVDSKKEVPKDAINICKMMGLSQEILNNLE